MADDLMSKLVTDRLSQSYECIYSAEADIKLGHLKSCANRSYYAIFHSMRAMLATIDYESKKHFGNISGFRKYFIKTGILNAKLSVIIDESYDLRKNSDYEDYFVVELPKAIQQLANAKHFYDEVKQHIESTTVNDRE